MQVASRQYRSKRQRPCDSCRSRKVCCRIESEPPCSSCQELATPCTFIQPTNKRLKPSPLLPILNPVNNVSEFPPSFDQTARSLNEAYMAETVDTSRILHSREQNPEKSRGYTREPGQHNINTSTPWRGDVHTSYQDTWDLYSAPGEAHPALETVPAETPEDVDPSVPWTRPSYNDNVAEQEFELYPGDFAEFEAMEHNSQQTHSRDNPTPEDGTASTVIQSLDQVDGQSAQFFGLSGESDPYLLRHFRWDESGQRPFVRVHFRRVGPELRATVTNYRHPGDISDDTISSGLSEFDKRIVPIHFALAKDELAEEAKLETTLLQDMTSGLARQELDNLIRPEDGRRMIALFIKHVFPHFPVVSRTQLGVTSESPIPSLAGLSKIPTVLLAAIYASSLMFSPYDDYLCVSNSYEVPEASKLWRIVQAELSKEIHTPHLSVIQSSLLYVQKLPTGRGSAAADTPYIWSLMASIVAQANSIGLHLECQSWHIPSWEKRLRRRLWWAVFTEEKWRSMVRGVPSIINDDQCDVSELRDEDFGIIPVSINSNGNDNEVFSGSTCDVKAMRFRYLAGLSLILSRIYHNFYTLKASKEWSGNLQGSLERARPIRQQLKTWYDLLPQKFKVSQGQYPGYSEPQSSRGLSEAPLQFSYLMAELFLYRALLRPLARSRYRATYSQRKTGGDKRVVDGSFEPHSNHGQNNIISQTTTQVDPAILSTVNAAVNCAKLVISFVSKLESRDFTSFWYSWLRIGFSTMSNFVVLLYAQAPTQQHAILAKELAEQWRETLRSQSKSFEQIKLGLLRLDSIFWIGLDEILKDPTPVG